MPLTGSTIKKAKSEAKQPKLYDELGLLIIISPKDGKWWPFKYLFEGKEKMLSLGTYPDVSLKDAGKGRVKPGNWLPQALIPTISARPGSQQK